MDIGHHQAAQRFREFYGTAGFERTVHKSVDALYREEISHIVTGGYAAQEYGCLRYLDNVDLIVPEIAQAFAVLRGRGFQPHGSSQIVVVDSEAGFELPLHAGGSIPDQDEGGDDR